MLSYKTQKEVAISCSWCKKAYHIKAECSKGFLLETTCTLGCHRNLVLPPSWIVKLPPRKVTVNFYNFEIISKENLRILERSLAVVSAEKFGQNIILFQCDFL